LWGMTLLVMLMVSPATTDATHSTK
jgi:hypothetical protein